jgi:type II secretory pathway component GspD/PulD (secretin)
MISEGLERSSSGVPGLSRIPVVGALFGGQRTYKTRNDVIVLLTPTIVSSSQQALWPPLSRLGAHKVNAAQAESGGPC